MSDISPETIEAAAERLHFLASTMMDASSFCPSLSHAEANSRRVGEELGRMANAINSRRAADADEPASAAARKMISDLRARVTELESVISGKTFPLECQACATRSVAGEAERDLAQQMRLERIGLLGTDAGIAQGSLAEEVRHYLEAVLTVNLHREAGLINRSQKGEPNVDAKKRSQGK